MQLVLVGSAGRRPLMRPSYLRVQTPRRLALKGRARTSAPLARANKARSAGRPRRPGCADHGKKHDPGRDKRWRARLDKRLKKLNLALLLELSHKGVGTETVSL